eukprot:766588-Hanusia_phi.AAC.2
MFTERVNNTIHNPESHFKSSGTGHSVHPRRTPPMNTVKFPTKTVRSSRLNLVRRQLDLRVFIEAFRVRCSVN